MRALVFAAGAGALTVTSQVNGSLVRTVHPAAVLRVALPSMLAIALALLTAALVDLGVWAIVGGVVIAGVTTAIILSQPDPTTVPVIVRF